MADLSFTPIQDSQPPPQITFKRIGGPSDTPEQKAAPGGLESLWNGMVHGLGNIVHGAARIGARMGAAPEIGQTEPSFSPERVKQVDETAAKREDAYQASPGVKAHPYFSKAGEIGGETVGMAAEAGPLAAVAPATAPLRLAWASLLGAGGALATPKGGESMAPTAQAVRGIGGAAGGLIGGAAGEGGGKLVRALVGDDPASVASYVTGAYRRVVKPSRGQRSNEGQLQTQDRQILSAVDDIIAQRGPQNTPKTLRDFSAAVDETKIKIFDQYDSMARGAQDLESGTPNPHLVDPFRASGARAQQAQIAVRDAQQAATVAAAQQARAGNNVYMSNVANAAAQKAKAGLAQAQALAQRAGQAHESIKARLYAPHIDLAPIAGRLRSMMRQPQFADVPSAAASEMQRFAGSLESRGFYGLKEAQDVLQSLNGKLSEFYRNPTPATASSAVADAEVAGMLRRSLDEVVTNLEGPGYQALRARYGALQQIEKDVVGAYQGEANKVPGGIGGIFADLWATEAGLKAAMTFDVHSLSTAVAAAGAKMALKILRDPNRAVAQLFARRAATFGRPAPGPMAQGASAGSRYLPAAGGLAGSNTVPRRRTQNDVSPPPSVR